ncbi:DUF2218 domain-containing protein [Demequina sp. NBRC 110053]|uniref:DUF2218 domain-containing protein n=1 Tax=Demequina sp. NBRC 110053 TaxID=1570342 RepID=UPI000A06A593|nr:DUF2218 domain-containing protein [Demequina sp. NBRC 110053]
MSHSITGRARTDRADHLATQLADHLGTTLPLTSDGTVHRIEREGVTGSVTETDTALEISLEATSAQLLFIAMDSVERTLVRFGESEGLAVAWDDSGLEQRYRDAIGSATRTYERPIDEADRAGEH